MSEIKIYRGNMTFREISDKFLPEELLPEEVWKLCKKKGYPVTWYVDPDILAFLQWFREQLGTTMYVNTWKWDKTASQCNWRAVRFWHMYTSKAKLSQHYQKSAIDFVVKGIKPAEVLKIAQDNFGIISREFGITTAESLVLTTNKDGWGWNHFDMRWWGRLLKELQIVGGPAYRLAT